jgi:hypothetical protein
MTRLARRITACFAIAALAFAQLAVSAYACPMDMPDAMHQAGVTSANGCDRPATPNLCERHCDYGASSVQSSPAPAIAPQLVPSPWRVAAFVPLSFSTPVREWIKSIRIEPPPLVRFGVLRI